MKSDCKNFNFLKSDDSINFNAFVNTLVVNFYETFSASEEALRDDVSKALSGLPDKSKERAYSDVIKIIARRENVATDGKSAVFSFKPTKLSEKAVTFIENVALSDESLSSFYRLEEYGKFFTPYICNTTEYLSDAIKSGKSVIFEAQLGALRDIDFGIYPYTSASTTLAAYAPIGAGIPFAKLDESIGIMKAYSSCVGEGPFTCELFGAEGDSLREAGGEYGAATGRPRRVGGFDVVASRYGALVQGCTYIALTKLDVLSYLKQIPVCVAYELDGKRIDCFPSDIDELEAAKPVYEYLPGFNCDISNCRSVEDLPKEALDYIRYIEKAVNCPIKYVSVGAEREAYIKMF